MQNIQTFAFAKISAGKNILAWNQNVKNILLFFNSELKKSCKKG